jgi:hypothetical protein
VLFRRDYHLDHTLTLFRPKYNTAKVPDIILSYDVAFQFHLEGTDGEGPERAWAGLNRFSSGTREMGPGSRRDTLDDQFGVWNYKKR